MLRESGRKAPPTSQHECSGGLSALWGVLFFAGGSLRARDGRGLGAAGRAGGSDGAFHRESRVHADGRRALRSAGGAARRGRCGGLFLWDLRASAAGVPGSGARFAGVCGGAGNKSGGAGPMRRFGSRVGACLQAIASAEGCRFPAARAASHIPRGAELSAAFLARRCASRAVFRCVRPLAS